MRDLYSVLQVTPEASDAEIKAAFRHLAKRYHPDLRPGDREAGAAFQEAKSAYAYLSNPQTRKLYDAFLADHRAAKRRQFRRKLVTMCGTCVLTAAVALLVMTLLHGGGAAFGDGLLAWVPGPAPQ